MADFLPDQFKTDPNLRSMFVDSASGNFHMAGTIIRPPAKLCQTYEEIANSGGNTFYNGSLADRIVADLEEMGSLIGADDLSTYRVRWTETSAMPLGRDTLYVTNAPTSGHIIGFILQILKGYSKASAGGIGGSAREELTLHRIVEAFKFAFAKRLDLCDPKFCDIRELMANLTSLQCGEEIRRRIDDTATYERSSHYDARHTHEGRPFGTAHISVIAPNGDAVSVTSSINF